jgi:hypothetical protein
MKKILIILWLMAPCWIYGQNITYVRGLIDTLASPEFYGRGYVNNGEKIAADFIVKQLKKLKVAPLKYDQYFQKFNLNINTFPGNVSVTINDQSLIPGKDFVMDGYTPTINKKLMTVYLKDNAAATDKHFLKTKLKNKAVIIDTGFKPQKLSKLAESPCVITITDHKPSWSVSSAQQVSKQTGITIMRNSLPTNITSITLDVESKFIAQYQTQNILAKIPGKSVPDSFVFFTAHYDHLGMMGSQTYFPGANDNASGTAMLLDLAAYYSLPEHQPDYTIIFAFFSSEEVGLLGSDYCASHLTVDKNKIKFLINLDMIGTGSEGIKVVNGSVFKGAFSRLCKINEEQHLLKTVSPRGEAANSDHYFFYKQGIPCFFIYTLGKEYSEYHTPEDKSPGPPLTAYNELFRLVTAFVKRLK